MVDKLYKIERKLLYKELEPLFKELSSVKYAVVKGEALSQQIYGVPDRRRSSDIDILTDKRNVEFLEKQLLKLGFKQKLPEDSAETRRNRVLCMAYSHQIPSYHKEKFGFYFNVDVNYDIFWGEYEGWRCSIDEFLSDSVDMEIYGVTVKTLPVEKAFVQLILHHYKEMNSLYHLSQHNTIRTEMFMDVYNMLKNNVEVLSSEIVKCLSNQYSIGKYMYYMLYFTGKVFEHVDFCEYVRKLKIYEDSSLLECYGLCTSERKKWGLSFEERLGYEKVNEYIQENLNLEEAKKVEINYNIFT